MKLQINFASAPFRNRRLFWLVLSGVVVLASYVGLSTLNSQATLQQQITVLEPEVLKLEAKAKDGAPLDFSGSSLTIGQNQALLVAQDLITRKGFSWSQLLNDLERYIPDNVRVTRIAVDKVGRKTDVEGKVISLSFDVVGKSPTAVTQMISDLNAAGRFAVYPVKQKQIEGMEDIEFQLAVEYRPSSSGASRTTATQVATQAGGVR